jgi:DnaK suppressor protein
MGIIKDTSFSGTIKDSSGDNSSFSFHMADQGTDAQEREKAFLFAYREGRLVYHIDQALERIDKNTYGYCHECGDPISPERLEAVPHARLCIKCKSTEETGKSS